MFESSIFSPQVWFQLGSITRLQADYDLPETASGDGSYMTFYYSLLCQLVPVVALTPFMHWYHWIRIISNPKSPPQKTADDIITENSYDSINMCDHAFRGLDRCMQQFLKLESYWYPYARMQICKPHFHKFDKYYWGFCYNTVFGFVVKSTLFSMTASIWDFEIVVNFFMITNILISPQVHAETGCASHDTDCRVGKGPFCEARQQQ